MTRAARPTSTDPKTAAAQRQAAAKGCANPLGWARWDFDAEADALRLRKRPVAKATGGER